MYCVRATVTTQLHKDSVNHPLALGLVARDDREA
jgi:hypothetical protein